MPADVAAEQIAHTHQIEQSAGKEMSNFVPSEEHSKHSELLSSHPLFSQTGIDLKEIDNFNSIFTSLLTCEGFISDNSFDLIVEYFLSTANEFLVFSLPTANFLRDALKSMIESYRMSNKRLSILEMSDEAPGPEFVTAKNSEKIDFGATISKVRLENLEKAHKICSKWIKFNRDLLDKSETFKAKIFENPLFKDLQSTFSLTISSLNRNIADIYRYQYELSDPLNQTYLEEADKHYKISIELSKNEYPKELNPCYLSSVLNYSVCLYDCRENHEEALKILQEAYETAFKNSKDMAQSLSPALKESTDVLLHVCIYNLQTWTRDQEMGDEVPSDDNDSQRSSAASLDQEANDE